ncbi:MAG: ABC transporter ATP-binding protein [Acidobacteriota bacterium]
MESKGKGPLKTLSSLLPYILEYKWPLLAGFIFIFIQNFCLVKIPLYMKNILDEIIQKNRLQIITGFMIRVFVFTIIVAASLYLMRRIIISVSRKIEYKMRKDIYNKLLSFDYPFFLKNETGDLSSRATNDLNDVRILLGPAVMYIPNSISRILIFFPVLIGLSGKLMLMIIPLLIFLVFITFYLFPKLRPKYRRVQETTALINSRVWQTVTGITTIKQNTLERTETERFFKLNRNYIKVQMEMIKLRSLLRPLFLFIFSILELIILLVGGKMVMANSFSLGQLLQFNIMISALIFPILSLGWIMSMVQLGISAMERINYILDQPVGDKKNIRSDQEKFEGISFSNLVFRYPGENHDVLKGVNFNVVPGELVGITGGIGSGKTTLLEILSGLLDPPPGMVFLNGRDITEINKDSIYSKFSVVSQDPFLFSGTIRHNIGIGMDKEKPDEIHNAAEIASLDNEINSFSEKYDQIVGERGITLSGGQKQRMAIARSICSPAPVLLFDDPLSSVDSKTETRILKNLQKLRKRPDGNFKTTFIVSHRISALKACDVIYVLKDGNIEESGNHRELLDKRGSYYKLSKMQQMDIK